MTLLYVKYQAHQPVIINTHFDAHFHPRGPITVVGELIAVYRVNSLLADTPLELLTLHNVINGVMGDALGPGTPLADLISGSADNPLVIKSQKDEMDVDIPAFSKSAYESRNLPLFPFFDPSIEVYLKFLGETGDSLRGRDDNIKRVNAIMSKRDADKYHPIICSTSRGMGKTAFMEAIGMQLVKPFLNNALIGEALCCGRVLSFDFAQSAGALATQDDIPTFFPRLMIFFLCRMFGGTQVDGIHFEETNFANVVAFVGKQSKFNQWKQRCLGMPTLSNGMIDEYIRLTNIAFGVQCAAPPVFLLDEIQSLCFPTTVRSMVQKNVPVYHSFLSLLLIHLNGKHKPLCISAGTSNGDISNIVDMSVIIPQFVSMTTLHHDDHWQEFWRQRTEYLNKSTSKPITSDIDDQVLSLVYASYQIPRLLLLAHKHWFKFKTTSLLTDRFAPLESYEEDAMDYYPEMAKFLFNSDHPPEHIARILMCCGVHWRVSNIYDCVPGTEIVWNSLIENSLVFPYVDGCYIIPFNLMLKTNTPESRNGRYTKARGVIEKACRDLVPNLDINDLFVSYDKLHQDQIHELGVRYETLFASSLAVKYYLCRLENQRRTLTLTDLYDFDDEGTGSISNIFVDFSSGIHLPKHEVLVDSPNLPIAVIHNKIITNAHHDIILPAFINSSGLATAPLAPINIAVSCKASFDLSRKGAINRQNQISKQNLNSVDLLVWLYLGQDEAKKECAYPNVVFMDGSGCYNGLALDMYILTKNLISQNKKRLKLK